MSGDAGQSTGTSTPTYDPATAAARAKILDYASSIYGRSATAAAQGYPGAKPIDLSPESLRAQQMLTGVATGPGQDVANMIPGALQFGLSDVLHPETSPGFQQTLDSATRRIGEEYTSPTGPLAQARGMFTGGSSGGTGTREGIASGLIGRSYLNTVGDVTGKMTSDAYSKGLDTFSKTMAFAPSAYGLMLQPGATMGAVGAQNESVAAGKENYAAALRQYAQTGEWGALQPYANLVSGFSQPGTSTTSTQSQFSQFMSVAGLAAMAAMIP